MRNSNIGSTDISHVASSITAAIYNLDRYGYYSQNPLETCPNDTYILGLNAGTYQIRYNFKPYIPATYGILSISPFSSTYKFAMFLDTSGNMWYRMGRQGSDYNSWYTDWQLGIANNNESLVAQSYEVTITGDGSNFYKEKVQSCAKTGYTALGVIGCTSSSVYYMTTGCAVIGTNMDQIVVTARKVDGSTWATSSTITFTVRVLYKKN